MKISEMIKNLQDFMNEYGDITCYYAVDDEGNDFKKIHYTPSPFYVDEDMVIFIRQKMQKITKMILN